VTSLTEADLAAYFDRLALEFHQERTSTGRLWNEKIERPAVLALTRGVGAGLRLLDVGCGSGIYSSLFAAKGISVTAIDISPGMLKIAKRHCAGLPVTFCNESFSRFQSSRPFDVVLCSFMIGYFSDLDSFMEKIEELLDPDGFAVLTMIHPVRLSAASRDDESYVLRGYFEPEFYDVVILKDEEPIRQAKRTLSEVTEAAWRAGLVIERLLEPRPSDPPVDARTRFYHLCPSVLALRLRKTK